MVRINPLIKTDSYKISHPRMYPDGTTELMTYTEARGGPTLGLPFLGFQIFVQDLAATKITKEDVEEARVFFKKHFMGADFFPYDEWMIVVNEYDGRIPVEIKAVSEGTYVPNNNVLMTVTSTDPRLFWMTSFLETSSLRGAWYPVTVGAGDFEIAKIIYKHLLITSDDPDGQFPFKHHDFGARGVSSSESAAIAGAVHTLIFQGSDTLEGVFAANHYYGFDMAAFSIPATEHSVTTAHGRANENLVVEKALMRFPGAPLVATVADSYDMHNFASKIIGQQEKQAILDSGKILVVRPDSGNAGENVAYLLQVLDHNFGSVVNEKGYKVLNHVRIINGDGNDREQIEYICQRVRAMGYSLDNVAFGTGGSLLQKVNRDTYAFATKLCAAKINGSWTRVFKDAPEKKSKGGLLDLVKIGDDFQTIDRLNSTILQPSELHVVYRNGKLMNQVSGTEVRDRVMNAIKEQVSLELTTEKIGY